MKYCNYCFFLQDMIAGDITSTTTGGDHAKFVDKDAHLVEQKNTPPQDESNVADDDDVDLVTVTIDSDGKLQGPIMAIETDMNTSKNIYIYIFLILIKFIHHEFLTIN